MKKLNKEKQKEDLPKISFVIATYNSGWCVEDLLKSIKKQEYPDQKIEILFIDGGSRDNTFNIAQKYNIKVIKNKLILGDPGNALGCEKAKGDFVVFVGHDNQLVQKNWLRMMIKPFLQDRDIVGAYPHLENRKSDTWLTKYVNKFTDPFNHFIYGYANNPLTFEKFYKIKKKTKDWILFDFNLKRHPLLAFDQGFMLRKKGYNRDKDTWYCDILPVLDLIKNKKEIVYVPGASNYHITLNKGIGQFLKKHLWTIDYNLSPKKTFGVYKKAFGIKARGGYISLYRRVKQFIYPFYGISIVLPLLRAIFMYIKDGEKEWFYHPIITFVSAYLIWKEAIRVLILHRDPVTERY